MPTQPLQFYLQVVILWVVSGSSSSSILVLYFIATSANFHFHLEDSTSFIIEVINMRYTGLTH